MAKLGSRNRRKQSESVICQYMCQSFGARRSPFPAAAAASTFSYVSRTSGHVITVSAAGLCFGVDVWTIQRTSHVHHLIAFHSRVKKLVGPSPSRHSRPATYTHSHLDAELPAVLGDGLIHSSACDRQVALRIFHTCLHRDVDPDFDPTSQQPVRYSAFVRIVARQPVARHLRCPHCRPSVVHLDAAHAVVPRDDSSRLPRLPRLAVLHHSTRAGAHSSRRSVGLLVVLGAARDIRGTGGAARDTVPLIP